MFFVTGELIFFLYSHNQINIYFVIQWRTRLDFVVPVSQLRDVCI